ncbi:MAG: translation elongation factor Ts [Rickettsiales bacterium]|jgi:elongation factor Ts|nr:translation elongation factor Ts [Rickettsiales bacterium]
MSELNLIKKLRELTGCGVVDCRNALVECKSDFEGAVDWLRKKGLSSAAKKSERIAAEGLIGLAAREDGAVILELNSESDFVARNDRFQNLLTTILGVALNTKKSPDFIGDVKNQKIGKKTVGEVIADGISSIGENIQLRRGAKIELQDNGAIVSYTHAATAKDMGKIGVLVALKSDADTEKLTELGKKIAMQIAATKPEFLSVESVPTEKLKRERDVLNERAKSSGKPANILDKIIEGQLKKFYEENCLLEQLFIMDDSMKIRDLLTLFKKETGKGAEIQEYCLYVLGEGLKKKEENFADEVASMAKK